MARFNSNLTVISVCHNDCERLSKTLSSISSCRTLPAKVIIVDGGSTDATVSVVDSYRKLLQIEFISEYDHGIYDAMNKGRRRVNTLLVHYLNAGDYLVGDPYAEISAPCLIPVTVEDELSGRTWNDFVKFGGFGYCHQGVIFPTHHEDYDLRYDLAADFKLLCRTFPLGLGVLPLKDTGKVTYPLGGVSSARSSDGVRQTLLVARESLPFLTYLTLLVHLVSKSIVPRPLRRAILGKLRL